MAAAPAASAPSRLLTDGPGEARPQRNELRVPVALGSSSGPSEAASSERAAGAALYLLMGWVSVRPPGAHSLAGRLLLPSESAPLWALSAGRAEAGRVVRTDLNGPVSEWAVHRDESRVKGDI